MQDQPISNLVFYCESFGTDDDIAVIDKDSMLEYVKGWMYSAPVNDGSDQRADMREHITLYCLLCVLCDMHVTTLEINRGNIRRVLLKYKQLCVDTSGESTSIDPTRIDPTSIDNVNTATANTDLVRSLHYLFYTVIRVFISKKQNDMLAFALENSLLKYIIDRYSGICIPIFTDSHTYPIRNSKSIAVTYITRADAPAQTIYMLVDNYTGFSGIINSKTIRGATITMLLLIACGATSSTGDYGPNCRLVIEYTQKYNENNKRILAMLGLYKKSSLRGNMHGYKDILRIIGLLLHQRRIIDCADV